MTVHTQHVGFMTGNNDGEKAEPQSCSSFKSCISEGTWQQHATDILSLTSPPYRWFNTEMNECLTRRQLKLDHDTFQYYPHALLSILFAISETSLYQLHPSVQLSFCLVFVLCFVLVNTYAPVSGRSMFSDSSQPLHANCRRKKKIYSVNSRNWGFTISFFFWN